MDYINVKRLHENAILPRKAHATDACFDLFAVDVGYGRLVGSWVFNIGIAIEIPDGYYGQILTRSKTATEGLHVIGGVIDAGYRGEIKVIVLTSLNEEQFYDGLKNYIKNNAIAQLAILPVPQFDFVEVDELSPSDRGVNGFGSTDQSRSARWCDSSPRAESVARLERMKKRNEQKGLTDEQTKRIDGTDNRDLE